MKLPSRKAMLLGVIVCLSLLPVPGSGAPAPGDSGEAEKGPATVAAARDKLASRAQFIAVLEGSADVSDAASLDDPRARRRAIHETKRAFAERAQAGVLALLEEARAAGRVSTITPLWIVNAVAFEGEAALADALRALPEVRTVRTDETVQVEQPNASGTRPSPVGTVEWNVARIRADEVWAAGITGANIVVGIIDTGEAYTHPAIALGYRGRNPDGSFSHQGNWFDVVEGSPAPVDPNGHGTHVLATAVGGDGLGPAGDDVGVAPDARWIAARAFDSSGQALLSDVLRAAQWIEAPTGANGLPDPGLAPDIAVAAWHSDPCEPLLRGVALSWASSGIFPVAAVGNEGGTTLNIEAERVGSPAEAPEAFGVTATTTTDVVADFARRGPSCYPDASPGRTKPDAGAPGVQVRSAVPGDAYEIRSGTSMAAPHAAGTAALVLEAARRRGQPLPPSQLQQLLRLTARSPDQCGDPGGGCGLLDARAAVQALSLGGTLTGVVTDASTSDPIEGATVTVTGAENNGGASATTDASGSYEISGLLGTYDVEVEAFGYVTRSDLSATVPTDTTVTLDVALDPVPRGSITGTVTHALSGSPLAGATVLLVDTPVPPATTASDGTYTIADVPEGDYTLSVSFDPCTVPETATVTVVGSSTIVQDFALDARRDAFGYFCARVPGFWVAGTDPLDFGGDDRSITLDLPFAFPFYGGVFTKAHVSSNGFVRFDVASEQNFNDSIPSLAEPNLAVYGLWDDLVLDVRSQVLTASGPDWFAFEWRDATFFDAREDRVTFAIVLHANGTVDTLYRSGAGARALGAGATAGIEGPAGASGLQYAFNEAILTPGLAVSYSPTLSPGLLRGTVTDSGAGAPVADATVRASTATTSRTTRTDAAGRYELWLSADTYTLDVSAFGFAPASRSAAVTAGATTTEDFALAAVPTAPLGGYVREEGTAEPIAGVQVSAGRPEIPNAVTDANGRYDFGPVPEGTYTVTAAPSGRCQATRSATVAVVAPGGAEQDFTTQIVRDAFPYTCTESTVTDDSWVSATDPVPARGDDDAAIVTLPFRFPLYGQDQDRIVVSTNGFARFGATSTEWANGPIPSAGPPNLAIYPMWDDLVVDEAQGGRVLAGQTGDGRFAIEWQGVSFRDAPWARATFQIVLHRDGDIELQYRHGIGALARGASATAGVESAGGATALQYSFNETALVPGLRVVLHPETHPLSGAVREASTGAGVFDATVTVRDSGGAVVAEGRSDIGGGYRLLVPEGTVSVTAEKFGFDPDTVSALLVDGPTTAPDLLLTQQPHHHISGTVTDQDAGVAVPGARVVLDNPNVPPTFTDGNGVYDFFVPDDTYTVRADGRCRGPGAGVSVTLAGADATADLVVPTLHDNEYHCDDGTEFGWFSGTAPLLLSGDDNLAIVPLPFEFTLYGRTFNVAHVSTNGFVRFDDGFDEGGSAPPGACTTIPCAAVPKVAVDAFWADLFVDSSARVLVGLQDPDTFVFEWRGVLVKSTGNRVTFAAALHRSGAVEFRYLSVPSPSSTAGLVGIETMEEITGTQKGLRYPLPVETGARIRFLRGAF